jgi:hypothetical protein
MTSAKQIQANRQNAQSSTGPKTEAGKQISSRNAFQHGLSSKFYVMDGEDPERIDDLLHQLVTKYQPDGPDELLLLERIVHSMNNRQRGEHMMQTEILAFQNGGPGHFFNLNPNIRRYIRENDRSVEQAFALFFRNRAELCKQNKALPTPKSANGFVSEEISLARPQPLTVPVPPLETTETR